MHAQTKPATQYSGLGRFPKPGSVVERTRYCPNTVTEPKPTLGRGKYVSFGFNFLSPGSVLSLPRYLAQLSSYPKSKTFFYDESLDLGTPFWVCALPTPAFSTVALSCGAVLV
jgi:hypothetical protein